MIVQTMIAALTIPALYLVGRQDHWRRWGFVIGLASQPFWLWATWSDQAWGMLIVAVFCTGTWALGVWNHWVVPVRQKGAGA